MRWAKGQVHMQTMQYFFVIGYPLMRLLGIGNNMTEVAHSMLACTRDGYAPDGRPRFAINARDISHLANSLNAH